MQPRRQLPGNLPRRWPVRGSRIDGIAIANFADIRADLPVFGEARSVFGGPGGFSVTTLSRLVLQALLNCPIELRHGRIGQRIGGKMSGKFGTHRGGVSAAGYQLTQRVGFLDAGG